MKRADRELRWDFGGRNRDLMLQEAERVKGDSLWADARRRLKANKAARISRRFLKYFCLLALLAPLLPLPSPTTLNLQLEPQAPEVLWTELFNEGFSNHNLEEIYWDLTPIDEKLVEARIGIFGNWQSGNWMGTDSKGRDILSRIIWGSRTSILVALAATLCSLLIGVTYGAFAGLVGGWVDNLMMRLVDILYSIPFIFVVIFILTLLNTSRDDLTTEAPVDREKIFFLVVGAIYWLTMARVVRGQVLSLRNSEFIDASRVAGASTARMLFSHILPNVLSIVIVYLTLTIPAVMLFEAFLSFLGLGIQPPKVSWGLLAKDGTDALNPIYSFWWLVVFPALAMGANLLALNFLGDGMRDALDPKTRGKD